MRRHSVCLIAHLAWIAFLVSASGCVTRANWSRTSFLRLAFTSGLTSSVQLTLGDVLPAIEVSVLDPNSNVVTSPSFEVSLVGYTDPNCTVLAGSSTTPTVLASATTTAGVASLPTLSTSPFMPGTYYVQASAPGATPTCSSSIDLVGHNLVVPIEMVDYGVSSVMSSLTTFNRTRTSLDTDAYDGVIAYYFEIVAQNSDSVSRTVSLVNAANTVMTNISVPTSTTVPTRIRSASFIPANSSDNYRIQLDGTTASNQLAVYAGRMIVQQTNATRTKIFIPLIQNLYDQISNLDTSAPNSGAATGYSTSLNGPQPFARWKKSSASYSTLSSSNPWTLEAVISSNDSAATASAALYNRDTGTVVSGSVLSTTSTTPVLVTASFSDSDPAFTNGSEFSIASQVTNTYSYYVHRGGLWVSLSSIEAAEIYNRVAMGYMGSLDLTYDHQRILLNGSSYSNPVFYFEINGYLDSGSTQPAYVADCGTTNDGVGNCTDTSTFIDLNFTPSSERIRSSSFSIIDGHRYALSVVPGGGPNMFLANAFVVIAIH